LWAQDEEFRVWVGLIGVALIGGRLAGPVFSVFGSMPFVAPIDAIFSVPAASNMITFEVY
jgi:hypothetical protein